MCLLYFSSVNAENGIDQERYIWAFIDNLTGGSVAQDPNLVYQWKVNGEISEPKTEFDGWFEDKKNQ